tara:strand:- start:3958 stop:4314 length:357 start_codon:yes stop_codon:yes gene_type:complete
MSRFYNSLRSCWSRVFKYSYVRPTTYQVRTQVENKKEDKSITTERSTNKDNVNSPPHYNQHGIECIQAIEAALDGGFESYLQGNIMKYLWRYKYKNGIEDLKKAEWYLKKLITVKEKK